MMIAENIIEELSERSLLRRLAEDRIDDLADGFFSAALADGEDLAALAARALETPDTDQTGETVFIMPGFFGSKLGRESRFHWFGNDLVWLDPFDIARGGLGKLKWDPDDTRIKPVGAFHISYALMRLKLRAAGIDARYLPYDWRKSAALNADILMPVLQRAGNVSLLTHSQGGRVARVLAERDAGADLIRRIITIAPPHHGLYQPVRTLAVAEDFSLLNLLDWLDHTRSARDLVRDVTNDLLGLIEMMPLIDKRPGENFYDPDWWPAGAEIPPPEVFQAALAGARALPDPDARFVTIAGAGHIDTPAHATIDGANLAFTDAVGDGTIALNLAEFAGVSTYYTSAGHSFMCNDGNVIVPTLDLLHGETTTALFTSAGQVPQMTPAPAIDVNDNGEVRIFFESLGG